MTPDGDQPLRDHADPARLAHFRILGRLGHGGMGVVYRAEDEKLRRVVALKLLADTSGDEERRQRFLREARSAAAITHPNVAVIHQVDEADGRIYIAMELVAGENLRARLERGPLTLATAKEIAAQIAAGLAAAHDQGIVHRDLKPENVMITPAGAVKLLDFGLAKVGVDRATGTEAELAKTETVVTSDEGRIMGTPEYMSPEQAMGEQLDVRSDVFSLGIVLYEMLSGTRPFTGSSTGAVLVSIARDPPAPLRERAPAVDEATEVVVMRCLAKARGERFADAGEVVAALSGHASPAATTQSRTEVQPLTRSGTARGRPRTAGVVAAMLAVAVAATAWWLAVQRHGKAPEATPPSQPVPRAMTEWPPPATSSPEAAKAYAAGLQAFRDGSEGEAARDFERAVALDHDFAAANVRLALLAGPMERTRALLATATKSRASLEPRDQRLLACLSDFYGDSNRAHANESARALARDLPDDAEMQLIAGFLLWSLDSMPMFDRALALDPKFADAEGRKGLVLSEAGDLDGALAAVDRCLAIAPNAASCVRRRAIVHSVRGDCGALEADARHLTTIEPSGYHGYAYLWTALAAKGVPVETLVPLAAKMEATGETPEHARRLVPSDAARLAVYTGDFASAEASLLALDKDEALAHDETEHSAPLGLLRLYIEEGDPTRAADAGADYLRRLPAWNPQRGLARTISLAALRRAGRVSEAKVQSMRDAWSAEWRSANPGSADAYEWAWFYAYPAETASDAREAIAALSGYPPQPKYEDTPWVQGAVGRVYALAGDADAAIPRLRSEAAWCGQWPVNVTLHRIDVDIQVLQDRFLFGQMLEQNGDHEGACAQYAAVLARWGHAKPHSVTAEKSRARATKLGCAP